MSESTQHGPVEILLVGVNHLTSDVALRDRLLIDADKARTLSHDLTRSGHAREIVALSTCHRAEITAVVEAGQARPAEIIEAWSRLSGVPPAEITEHSYVYLEEAAVQHLFRVGASLDSLVLGESQIFGQVKDSYEAAIANGTVSFYLDHIFRAAIRVGKRVRSETRISEGAVSISYAAVELAKKILGDLSRTTVGIIGSGEMGALAAGHLHKANARRFIIFNRSLGSAEQLATQFQAEVCLLDQIDDELHRCDVVISATDSPTPVLTRDQVHRALRRRHGGRLFLIDISAPRDIEPAAGDLANTYLFTIDDLRQVVHENETKRRDAAAMAEAIVQQNVATVTAWRQGLAVRPLIKKLREKYSRLAAAEVETASRGMDAAERERLESFSRKLVGKLLHGPLSRMKEFGEEGNGHAAGYYANEIFGLSDNDDSRD